MMGFAVLVALLVLLGGAFGGVASAQGPEEEEPKFEKPAYSKPDRPVKAQTGRELEEQAAANAAISFTASLLQGETSFAPTSLQFGPDGKLYVADVNGVIQVYTIVRNAPTDYQVVGTETINLINDIPNHNDDGSVNSSITSRQVTGLLVTGSPTNPILYVSSSDSRIGGGSSGNDQNLDTNSGILSRITQTTSETWLGAVKLDLIRGLPRSEENHSPNGMAISGNTLYLAMGGNTNMGAPSNNFAFLPEYPLAAAILSIDLAAIGETTYDLPTLDDPTRGGAGQPAENDPFGGNNGLNQAKLVEGGPVQVHAGGFRNPYDVIIASDGRMYSIDNGPNSGWGDRPVNEGPGGNCTNDVNEPGQTQQDNLHYIRGTDYYGGHPNPARANPQGIFGSEENSPVPFSMAKPVECDHRDVGTDGSLESWNFSTNGFTEYTASNFDGELQGDLLATGWNSQQIFRAKVSYDANDNPSVDVSTTLFNSVGNNPLDITAQGDNDIFPGTVWVASLYGGGPIKVYEPAGFTECGGGYNSVLDEDGDGFNNADEIDNNTDPCSPADVPPDNDGDLTSDLNDDDDDNDTILDINDPFAIDANNGGTSLLPVVHTWDNDGGEREGLLGLGFTGLMINGSDNYLDLFDEGNMTAGGAGGLATIDNVPEGDALDSTNTQEYGFQFGVATGATGLPFTAHTGILTPFSGITPQDNQSMGLFIGTGDQDNYLKMVVAANGGNGGIQIIKEEDGVVPINVTYGPSEGVSLLGVNEVDLYLMVDPATNTVQPSYAIDGGARTALGPAVTIPASWIEGPNAMAAGLISTSSGLGPAFTATWDEIGVDYETTALNGEWQPIATSNEPTARHENAFIQVDGKFYLMGGSGNKPVQIYDPSSDSWTDGATPPLEMHHFQAVEYDEQIVVIGGYTGACCSNESGLTHIYYYDPITDSWSQGSEIPVNRRRGSTGAVVYNNKIYITGGLDGGHGSPATSYAWFDEYDPASDTWTELPDMPRVRDHFHAALSSEKLYVAGGRDTSDSSIFGATIAEVDVYDFVSGQWSTLSASSNLPTPRGGTTTAVLGNEILVIGGESGTQTDAHNETEALDTTTNSWRSVASLNTARHGTQVAVCNEGLYIVAGSGSRGGSPELTSTEAFFLNGQTPCIADSEAISGLSVESNSPVVLGNTTDFTTTVATGSNITYEWNFGDGTPAIIAGSTVTHSYTETSNYTVMVTATNSLSSDSATTAVQIIDQPLAEAIRINSGGPTVSTSNLTYDADNSFTGGQTHGNGSPIEGTVDDLLYQTTRHGDFSYNIPVTANGCYTVRLHFAEIWFGAIGGGNGGIGSRTFDVALEGQPVLANYDIYEQAGGAQLAILEQFDAQIEDSVLNIDFTSIVNNALISAIEVAPTGLATCPPQPIAGLQVVGTTPVILGTPTEFTASVTTGHNISYEWDFGDGSPTITAGETISHTYPAIDNYTVIVTATNDLNSQTATTTVDVTEQPPAGAIYINAGGPAVTIGQVVWAADNSFSGGGTYGNGFPIEGTTEDELYQSERYGNFEYNIPQIANSCYTVKLHFAEIWFGATGGGTGGVGSRIFNVQVEGQDVLSNYDIYEAIGGAQIAVVEEILVQVDDNQLHLNFTSVVNQAKISAIEVIPTGEATCPSQPISGLSVEGTTPVTTLGDSTDFTATVAIGNNIGYEWDFGDGSSPVVTESASISHLYGTIDSYTVTVTATNDVSSETATTTVEIVDVAPATTIRINSGGPSFTSNVTWDADHSFSGGNSYNRIVSIAGTNDDQLYQAERYGNFSYNVAVPSNGCYTTRLHFAEIWFGTIGGGGTGSRVFDVALEGQLVLDNYDIYDAAGGAEIAVIEQFDVQVDDGELTIELTSVIDNAKISAVEVIPTGNATCSSLQTSGESHTLLYLPVAIVE